MVKKIKYKCPKCERIVKKFHHLASYADRLCSKCLDAHVKKELLVEKSMWGVNEHIRFVERRQGSSRVACR